MESLHCLFILQQFTITIYWWYARPHTVEFCHVAGTSEDAAVISAHFFLEDKNGRVTHTMTSRIQLASSFGLGQQALQPNQSSQLGTLGSMKLQSFGCSRNPYQNVQVLGFKCFLVPLSLQAIKAGARPGAWSLGHH